MDVDIDRGDILLQKEFEIDPRESLDQLIKRTKRLGADRMLECLSLIEEVGFKPLELPDVEPSYFSFPTREHVRRFRRKGYRLL